MTPAQRETLENLYAYAASRAEWHPSLMPITDPAWDLDDLAECVEMSARWGLRALALRAALVERTCGNCHHGERLRMMNGSERVWCHIYHRHQHTDDGCIKGWSPREDAPEDAR